jgi:putative flippase GtrA
MTLQSLAAYCVVSGICLLLNNAILIAADLTGCTLFMSVLLSYAVVVVTGYLLHSLISFRQPFGVAAFGRYAFAMAANLPMMFVIIWVGRNLLGLPMSMAAPLATGCMVLTNYLLSHWAVSGHRERAGSIPP